VQGPAYFVSDLHLHGGDPDGVERACRFVDHVVDEGARTLGLLGDVFLAWRGPRSLEDEGLAPFLDALARAGGAGVAMVHVHGNHDFLVGAAFERALGVRAAGPDLEIVLGTQRLLLTHGDRFCTRDRGYHLLHAVLRSRPARWLFDRLGDRAFDALESALLRGSRAATRSKDPALMAMVDDAIEVALESGIDAIVCGHVHRARDKRMRAGRLVVMADFETTGSHARWRDGALELVASDRRFGPPGMGVVAIDGPAGSGKSTLAGRLARRLGWVRLDSGALYRALTRKALDEGLVPGSAPGALGALAGRTALRLEADGRVWMDGEPVSDEVLRGPEVTAHVSSVAADPGVRARLLPVQRRLAREAPGLVAEGRDMASVVFPHAALKVWIDARPDVRARRRLAQRPDAGGDLAEVEATLRARDRLDSERAVAPLARAPDMVVLDTSELDADASLACLLDLVRDRGLAPR